MFKPYQLMVKIYKGESFPNIDEKTACSPFLVIMTQNIVWKTNPLIRNSMPTFNYQINFPIFKGQHFYDDKIVMSLWD